MNAAGELLFFFPQPCGLPHIVPERLRKERPPPTPANPFQQPDVANVQPYSDEIKFSPG